jgi:carnosine N-methyltransferase
MLSALAYHWHQTDGNPGFSCQGNEFSHYMLLASFFVLNRSVIRYSTVACSSLSAYITDSTDEIEKHTIYPYVHTFSNLQNRDAILLPVKIPDVLPSTLPKSAQFSLVAGQ